MVAQPNVVAQPQNVEELFEENLGGESNIRNENGSHITDNLEEAYSRTLNIKRVRRLPSRFNDFEMNHMLLTTGIDLYRLSKFKRMLQL